MSKKITKMIDGVRYYNERPNNCKNCYFWKNKKVGCILGKENCYYLAEIIKTEQESECDGCCYAKARPCVTAYCYKEMEHWLMVRRRQNRKAGEVHVQV